MSKMTSKNTLDLEKSAVKQYVEIMRLVPQIQFPAAPNTSENLSQPSLLRDIDSITTYGVNCLAGN